MSLVTRGAEAADDGVEGCENEEVDFFLRFFLPSPLTICKRILETKVREDSFPRKLRVVGFCAGNAFPIDVPLMKHQSHISLVQLINQTVEYRISDTEKKPDVESSHERENTIDEATD